MADWSKPTVDSQYANYTSEITGLLNSLVKGMDSNYVSDANVPATAIRWNSTGFKWERYSGSVWGDLAATYGITAAYAANLSAGGAGQVPWQSAAGTTGFVAAGAVGSVFTSGGNGSPTWTPQANLSVGIATRANMLAPRVTTVSTANSVTPNIDTTDIVHMTNNQVAGNFTVNAPTGTPVDGQTLIIRLKSTNAQTYVWNSAYRGSSDLSLPSVSTAGKTDYTGFKYNTVDSKWDLLSSIAGF